MLISEDLEDPKLAFHDLSLFPSLICPDYFQQDIDGIYKFLILDADLCQLEPNGLVFHFTFLPNGIQFAVPWIPNNSVRRLALLVNNIHIHLINEIYYRLFQKECYQVLAYFHGACSTPYQ
jgi:hypothetical protein